MPAADRRVRVAIDARYWRSAIQTGVERYILLLLEALQTVNHTVDVAVVVHERELQAFPLAAFPHVRLLPVATRHLAVLDAALDSFDPALVHYPFDLPARFGRPSVYTLHDPGRYLFPELMVRRIRDVHNDRLREQLHDPHLRAVVTVSNSSRSDIEGVFGRLPKPLTVVPNFVSRPFAAQLAGARRLASVPQTPFLLAVGVYIPTKNIPRLVRAFRQARKLAPDVVPAHLTLVGRIGWERGFPINGAHDLTVLRHVTDNQLAGLFATCNAFLWPTFYEGFGLPVHEALLAGARVLCSDIPVNREIASDLVHYTDPHDDDQMAKAIVTRCLQPAPSIADVGRHLAPYNAAAAGAALMATYRAALGGLG